MKMSSAPKRSVRVADRLRKELSLVIARELRDPRLEDVIITRVEMPDDLSLARVLVRLVTGPGDASTKKQVLSGLVAATGRLRKTVGARIGLRRTPELRFYWDDGIDASDHIDNLLAEIERERKERE